MEVRRASMVRMIHRKYHKILRHLDTVRDDLYGLIVDGRGEDEPAIMDVVDALNEVYKILDEVFEVKEPRPRSRD